VAFGSRLPSLFEERSPVLPGSLARHQDSRDIVDAPSVMLVSEGDRQQLARDGSPAFQ
jgi:hypothetical protein